MPSPTSSQASSIEPESRRPSCADCQWAVTQPSRCGVATRTALRACCWPTREPKRTTRRARNGGAPSPRRLERKGTLRWWGARRPRCRRRWPRRSPMRNSSCSRARDTCPTLRTRRGSSPHCASSLPASGSVGQSRGMDLSRFASRYPFALDAFQLESLEALNKGESVLVAAPTGAGKTVVAEFAIERALALDRKAFYTTPLKALSNQKFGDFVARYGASTVGLLTGDNSINSEAPVVVMTTEVLRNMLYEGSATLDGLEVVIMDEVHYLQDPYRGAVWEEILIHLPLSVSMVCLSATVSNAEEFGEWLTTLRGTTRVVIEEKRPVPLEQLYMVGRELHPMHVERDGHRDPNPYIVSLNQRELRRREYTRRGGGPPR